MCSPGDETLDGGALSADNGWPSVPFKFIDKNRQGLMPASEYHTLLVMQRIVARPVDRFDQQMPALRRSLPGIYRLKESRIGTTFSRRINFCFSTLCALAATSNEGNR